MSKFDFTVSLSTKEMLSIYEGKTRFVVVKSDEGVKLRLPAINFRSFVTSTGVHGRFRVTIDSSNKMETLRKL